MWTVPCSLAALTCLASLAMADLARLERAALFFANARSDFRVTSGLGVLVAGFDGDGESELGFLVGLSDLPWEAEWLGLSGLLLAWATPLSRPNHQVPPAMTAI